MLFSKNLRLRIVKNIGANAFGQAINILIQVLSVPIFLNSWGVELYGEWLVIISIPTYLSMSDLSVTTVAGNEMTMNVAQGDKNQALSIFQSTFFLVTCISLTIAFFFIPIIWAFPWEKWLKITHQSHNEMFLLILPFIFYVLLGLQLGILFSGFRCDNNYPLGAILINLTRLAEYIVVLLLVYLGSTPIHAAFAFLIIRFVGYILMRIMLLKCSPWISFQCHKVKFKVIKKLIKPSLTYIFFPVGYALNNQGMIAVVSTTLGSKDIVIFSLLRTLSRFILQMMNVINQGLLPEISAAYGKGNIALIRLLHRRSCQISIWFSFIIIISLVITGSFIIQVWTNNKVIVSTPLLSIFLVPIIASAFWSTSSCVIRSTNKHHRFAVWFLANNILSIFIAIILANSLGLVGVAISILCAELLICMCVIHESLFFLQEKIIYFTKAIIALPKIQISKIFYW